MTIFINHFLTNLLAKWFNLWGEYIRHFQNFNNETILYQIDLGFC